MAQLNSKQRAHLRSLAHPLKPILQIGADGVSGPFLTSLAEAFNTRELLKVRVLEGAEMDAREAAGEIAAGRPEVQVVQTIGRTIVLFRRFPAGSGRESEIDLP
jgi:RNA-binding protein